MAIKIDSPKPTTIKAGDLVAWNDIVVLVTAMYSPNLRGVALYKDGAVGEEGVFSISKCTSFGGTVTISNK